MKSARIYRLKCCGNYWLTAALERPRCLTCGRRAFVVDISREVTR